MDKMRKALENQQKINDAAKAIMEYFGEEMPYSVHLEQMLDAQTQIIGLMELAKHQMLTDPNSELDFQTDEITLFLRDVRHYVSFLKPFIELVEK